MNKGTIKLLTVIQILLLIAAGCSGQPAQVSQGMTAQPGNTETATVDQSAQTCGYMWASKALTDVSSQLQEAIQAAGLKGVSGRAEAYGENCVDENQKVVSFSAMETDFRIQVETESLKDRQALGNLAEQILIILDKFPAEKTPGPQAGYVGIAFKSGQDSLNLWFPVSKWYDARQLGLHGEDLLTFLQNK